MNMVTVKTAATRIGCSYDKLKAAIRSKKLECTRIDGKMFFTVDQLELAIKYHSNQDSVKVATGTIEEPKPEVKQPEEWKQRDFWVVFEETIANHVKSERPNIWSLWMRICYKWLPPSLVSQAKREQSGMASKLFNAYAGGAGLHPMNPKELEQELLSGRATWLVERGWYVNQVASEQWEIIPPKLYEEMRRAASSIEQIQSACQTDLYQIELLVEDVNTLQRIAGIDPSKAVSLYAQMLRNLEGAIR